MPPETPKERFDAALQAFETALLEATTARTAIESAVSAELLQEIDRSSERILKKLENPLRNTVSVLIDRASIADQVQLLRDERERAVANAIAATISGLDLPAETTPRALEILTGVIEAKVRGLVRL